MSNQQLLGNRGDVFDTLSAIDRGGFAHDLQDAMKEVVQECVGTQKKGKVTIEIEIDPDSKTDTIRVSGKIKKTLPQLPKKASIFYPTADGMLTRMDSRQRMIPGTEAEYAPPTKSEGAYDPETGEITN